jgi:hypothetical protein
MTAAVRQRTCTCRGTHALEPPRAAPPRARPPGLWRAQRAGRQPPWRNSHTAQSDPGKPQPTPDRAPSPPHPLPPPPPPPPPQHMNTHTRFRTPHPTSWCPHVHELSMSRKARRGTCRPYTAASWARTSATSRATTSSPFNAALQPRAYSTSKYRRHGVSSRMISNTWRSLGGWGEGVGGWGASDNDQRSKPAELESEDTAPAHTHTQVRDAATAQCATLSPA